MRKLLAAFITVFVALSISATATARTEAYGPFFQYQMSTQLEEGVASNIEISKPIFPHSSSAVIAYVQVQSTGGHTFQAGWYYDQTLSKPMVFTNKDGTTTLYNSTINAGQYAQFRARDLNQNSVIGEINVGQGWEKIDTYPNMWCRTPSGLKNCIVTVGSTVVDSQCDPSNAHNTCPSMNAPLDGNGVNFNNIQYRSAPNVWNFWSAFFGTVTHNVSPYNYCLGTPFTSFRTARDSC